MNRVRHNSLHYIKSSFELVLIIAINNHLLVSVISAVCISILYSYSHLLFLQILINITLIITFYLNKLTLKWEIFLPCKISFSNKKKCKEHYTNQILFEIVEDLWYRNHISYGPKLISGNVDEICTAVGTFTGTFLIPMLI